VTKGSPEVLLAVLGLATAQLLAAVPSKSPAIGVTPGDVTDRRRNDNTFAGLEVELKLTGEAAGGARGARALVEKAVDDTGRNLVKEGGRPADFEKASGQGSPVLKLDLRNPARRAKSVHEISGSIEVFLPDRDPAAVASADRFLSRMDRPIAAPALKAAQTEVTVVSRKTYDAEKKKDDERKKKESESAGIAGAMVSAFSGLFEGLFGDIGENDVLVRVTDPEKKVFGVEVFDAGGKRIDDSGSMKVGEFWIVKFTEKLPADASLRIYLMTPKALVTAPFSLKDVALP
jgi:hypothetical protein